MLTHHTIEETDEERMEEQANVEEESVPQKKPEYYKYVDYWQIIVKFTELILCILCTALIIDPLNSKNIWPMYQHHISFIFATICGYIIIISVVLLGRLFGDRLPFKTSAFFSLLGSGLFLTAGCIILSDRTHFSRSIVFHPNRYLLDMMSTSGVIAILNSLTFSLDAIFTLRLQNDL